MSRTYRNTPEQSFGFRHPHTQNERRQLNGLVTDAKLHQVAISPVNRISRHIPSDVDDVKVASFAETFFQD
tara:strand:+ start:1182 stop:1394 length:213 start_codon:yes stop_codon:yes gene_type:complete